MNIFDKRPLFLIITAFISGFVGFTFSDGWVRGLLLTCAILFLALSLIFYYKKIIKNIILVIISFAIIIAMAFSYIYFDIHFKLYDRYDTAVSIEGKISSIEEGKFYSTIIIQTEKIEKQNRHGYKIRLQLNNYDLGDEYDVGSKVSFKAKLCEFENFGDIDAKAYYFSDGISADAKNVEDIKIIGKGNVPVSSYAEIARKFLSDRAETLSNKRCGSLFSALFLGERDLLDNQIKLDFKRIGITHILALSGLHLSIISLGISKVLSAVRVKKKTRLVIVSIFVLIYMIVTGLSVSVARAGIMIILSSALFLLEKTKDSVTSLGIAVLVILLISPYAVFDLALWLSALSTLGIVATSDLEEYDPTTNIWKTIAKTIITSLKASLFATSATLIITLLSFDALSLASAVATFVFSIFAETIIYLGMLMLIFGNIIPIGFVLNYVSDAIYYLANVMAQPDWIYICTDYTIILIVAIAYTVGFALFLSLKLKNKKRTSAILAVCFVVIMILSLFVNLSNATESISICNMDEKGDRILLRSNSNVALISSSDYSSAEAYKSYELLSNYKITYLNVYYVTNYSWELLADIEKITSLIKVDTIYIPSPQNQEEEYILEDLTSLMEHKITNVYLYEIDEEITWNEYKISALYRSYYGDKYEKNAFRISHNDDRLLYLSPGMMLGGVKLLSADMIFDSNVIIFGCYGYKSNSKINIDVYNKNIKSIYIGNSKLTFDLEVYQRYKNSGTEINRDATIELFN